MNARITGKMALGVLPLGAVIAMCLAGRFWPWRVGIGAGQRQFFVIWTIGALLLAAWTLGSCWTRVRRNWEHRARSRAGHRAAD